MDFASPSSHGFVRVAACATATRVADPAANLAAVLQAAQILDSQAVAWAVFPELCLSGYAIDDLLLQDALLEAVRQGLAELIEASRRLNPVLVVGAPLVWGNRLLNCAVALARGRLLGVVPKSYLPCYREFYERRWFAPGDDVKGVIELAGQTAPIGPDLLFSATDRPAFTAHVEICEDMWVPVPPSAPAALAGATVLNNLSGSPITVGRARDRRRLARSASARSLAAYLYTAAGAGESSTDLAWDGQTMIFELGEPVAQGDRFASGPVLTVADLDLDRIRQERLRQGSFDDNRRGLGQTAGGADYRRVEFSFGPLGPDQGLLHPNSRFPFVPDDPARLAEDCYEAYNIQVAGLAQRLTAIGQPKVVIGVSGGLDSTHALIVAARAMDRLERPRSDILAFTLPGFATSDRTKAQALALMEAVGATAETIDIRPAAQLMLADLGHRFADGQALYDVTFENVQAGLRTDYLFRAANQRGGLVLGTGDLSELALGWCTYGVGDQMSHYAVNSGVPKTLIQHLIRWVAQEGLFDAATNAVLTAVLAQEITPELVPAAAGDRPQSTEGLIGPYALHDFFLYHFLRHGRRPSQIAYLAWQAWHDADAGAWPAGWDQSRRLAFDLPAVKNWLTVFLNRFFTHQFKRSALPNGPKVSAGGALSPRGDWRMPADASPAAWLAELEAGTPDDLVG